MDGATRTSSDTTTTARATGLPGRWPALGAAVFLLAASAFAIGEPFADLSLTRALTMTAIWVLPTVVLTSLALAGRTWAATVAVAASLALIVVQAVVRPVEADTYGPSR